MPYIEPNGAFVPVGYDFIFNKMPEANGTYVKIYLYILASAGRNIEYSEIAKALSVLESDVVNGVDYWVAAGVLNKNEDRISQSALASGDKGNSNIIKEEKNSEPVFEKSVAYVQKSDYTNDQVSDAVVASPALREMMAMAEEILAKPLNPSEMETLFWFYDGLGFSPEAVLMLLEYCVSKNKPRISYAEKVAVSWCERGLITPEDISKYLRDSERYMEEIKIVMNKLGMGQRPLAQGEEQFFEKWFNTYLMNSDMMLLANEYCVMQIGKSSFQYIDKILERWHSMGIHTPQAAKKEHEEYKSSAKKPAAASGDDNYAHTDLEQFMR